MSNALYGRCSKCSESNVTSCLAYVTSEGTEDLIFLKTVKNRGVFFVSFMLDSS